MGRSRHISITHSSDHKSNNIIQAIHCKSICSSWIHSLHNLTLNIKLDQDLLPFHPRIKPLQYLDLFVNNPSPSQQIRLNDLDSCPDELSRPQILCNACSCTLSERKEIVEHRIRRLQPSLRSEPLRLWEYLFILM